MYSSNSNNYTEQNVFVRTAIDAIMEHGYETDDCVLVKRIQEEHPLLSEFNCACALEAARELVLKGTRPSEPEGNRLPDPTDAGFAEDLAECGDEDGGEQDEIEELLDEEHVQ
jgi:hypothetical protein